MVQYRDLCLLLLAGCATGPDSEPPADEQPPDTEIPWFVGKYEGVTTGRSVEGEDFVLGSGSVALNADGTFDLQYDWVPEAAPGPPYAWAASGSWTLSPATEPLANDLDEVRVSLLMTTTEVPLLIGRTARARVSRDELVVGFGPCVAFFLPRAR